MCCHQTNIVSIVVDMRGHLSSAMAVRLPIHDLTEIGAHPYRLLEVSRDWISRHLQYGFTKPGKLGEGTFFGSDFVILWFDAHYGSQNAHDELNGAQPCLSVGQDCIAGIQNVDGGALAVFSGRILLFRLP